MLHYLASLASLACRTFCILPQLTHYLDLVEVQIARQIADKSEAFFDAMSSHDSLMDQLTQASGAVRALRYYNSRAGASAAHQHSVTILVLA